MLNTIPLRYFVRTSTVSTKSCCFGPRLILYSIILYPYSIWDFGSAPRSVGGFPKISQNGVLRKSIYLTGKTPNLWNFRSTSYMTAIGYSRPMPFRPIYCLKIIKECVQSFKFIALKLRD